MLNCLKFRNLIAVRIKKNVSNFKFLFTNKIFFISTKQISWTFKLFTKPLARRHSVVAGKISKLSSPVAADVVIITTRHFFTLPYRPRLFVQVRGPIVTFQCFILYLLSQQLFLYVLICFFFIYNLTLINLT